MLPGLKRSDLMHKQTFPRHEFEIIISHPGCYSFCRIFLMWTFPPVNTSYNLASRLSNVLCHLRSAGELCVILYWNCEEMACLLERTWSEFAKVLFSKTKGFYVHTINLNSIRFFTYFIQYLISSVHKSLMITDIKCAILEILKCSFVEVLWGLMTL